jgi:hydroxyethylthiazole kinase-like uncharacterized protein yjeF
VLKVATPKQMAAADAAAANHGSPSIDLMERAGFAVAKAAVTLAGGSYGKRFVVVCGKGNNAGDGFVAARRLREFGGFPIVVLAESPSDLKGDARANFDRLRGVRVLGWDDSAVSKEINKAAVIIDALFGTGFRAGITEPARSLISHINDAAAPVLSIDIPSGVNGETGEVAPDGLAVTASVTVTMAALKRGLVLYPGAGHAGQISIADIGIPEELIEADVEVVEQSDVRSVLPTRSRTAHKRSVGSVFVVAGSVGMSGAAVLTASAALRSGAGYVTVGAPSSVAMELDQSILETTTLPLPETARGTIEASAIEIVLERAKRFDVVALGPGLSTDGETVEFVKKLVAELDKPLVMDADAINAFQDDASGLTRRSAPTLLTPHPGELARLMNSSSKEIESDRIGTATEAARKTKSVVLLKGFRTVIASPQADKRVVLCPTGGPALATAGTGDVLTGIVSAFLAEVRDAFDSAWAAAWVHGRAGDLLGEKFNERSVKAGDVVDIIPEVLSDVID